MVSFFSNLRIFLKLWMSNYLEINGLRDAADDYIIAREMLRVQNFT